MPTRLTYQCQNKMTLESTGHVLACRSPDLANQFSHWANMFLVGLTHFSIGSSGFPIGQTSFAVCKTELRCKDTFRAPWKDELRGFNRRKIRPSALIIEPFLSYFWPFYIRKTWAGRFFLIRRTFVEIGECLFESGDLYVICSSLFMQ